MSTSPDLLAALSLPRRWRISTLPEADLKARFQGQDTESIRAGAFHVLPVKKIARECDPLACWVEQDTPISPQEVWACMEAGKGALVETPLWTALLYGNAKISVEENRQRHIRKIAYFMSHPILEPISIDVGCPSLGGRPIEHLVDDGNHRLAACILTQQLLVNVRVAGEMTEAKARGLWNPTCEEQEVCRREIQAWEQQVIKDAQNSRRRVRRQLK